MNIYHKIYRKNSILGSDKVNIRKMLQNMINRCRTPEDNSIDYQNVKEILKKDKHAILLDVRSEQEYMEYHLEGSINIPLYDLERQNKKIECSKQNVIIVYCQSGKRSKKAINILEQEGYNNVYELKGGLDEI